jgi:hypothetical protein
MAIIITLGSLIKSDWSVGSALISQVGKENPYFCILHLPFSTDRFKSFVIRIPLIIKDKILFHRFVAEVLVFPVIRNSRYLDPSKESVKF